MQNIICIDATNQCNCDLVSSTNDNTNRILLDIKADLSLNPVLHIFGTDISINTSDFLYEITSDRITVDSNITFYISDDSHVGDTFTLKIPSEIMGNWYVRKHSNFTYYLVPIQAKPIGGYTLPVATETTLGGVKVGKNLNITSDGKLNADVGEAMEPITNMKLEELLGGAEAVIETVPIIADEYIESL